MSLPTIAPQRLESQALDHPRLLTALPHRTALLDRIALRIALWLLLWSTRPVAPAPSAEQRRARAEREHEWRRRRLQLPHNI